MKERKKYIIIISLILIVIVTLGISYALLAKNISGNSEKIIYKIGDLEVKLDESSSEDISLTDALPTEDSEGLKSEPYSFSLINNSNTDLLYIISLEDDVAAKNKCGTDCKLIPYKYIRYSLTADDENLEVKDLSSTAELYQGIIGSDVTKKFQLRIWLAIDADNTAMNKYYFGKLKVVVEHSGNSNLNKLCQKAGGDLVVDGECRKYYVKVNNLIKNPSFSNNGENWTIHYSKLITIDDRIMSIDCTDIADSCCGLYQQPLEKVENSHKYYIAQTVRSDSSTKIINLGLENVKVSFYGTLVDKKWHTYSFIVEANDTIQNIVNTTNHAYVIYSRNEFTTKFYTKNPVFLDLTLMFGSGNEPSKEWCDKNLNKYIEYNETGISKPISDINYEGVTSYYDVINLNNK